MVEELFEIIKKHDIITIFGHLNPDGDCFGSQISLRDTLRLRFPEKKIYAIGSGVRRFKPLIGEMDIVDDDVIKESLAILVDGNDIPRMEDKRCATAKAWIKFDHHVDVGSFTQGPSVVREDANSCCEIIADFIVEQNLDINDRIANALYLGILTDTGRFQFIQDFPKTFRQAAWLCENGADPKKINSILNMTNEMSMSFKGFVFSNYRKTEQGVIYLTLKYKDIVRFNLTPSKAGSMVNLISNVEGYPIWAFFCEEEDGKNHAEFRSNGPAVQPIASKYGGGGHMQAAGVTLPDSKPETIQKVVDDLNETVLAFQKEN